MIQADLWQQCLGCNCEQKLSSCGLNVGVYLEFGGAGFSLNDAKQTRDLVASLLRSPDQRNFYNFLLPDFWRVYPRHYSERA